MEVRREIVLPEPREDVWEALTEPERLEQWFANEVVLELEPGGTARFRWENGESRLAVFEEVVPARRLAFRWLDEEAGETRVTFTLDDVEERTRLVVTESPLEPRAFAGEWSSALALRATSLVRA